MKLELEHHEALLLVRVLEPRLDAALAIRFKDELRPLVAKGTPRLLLDLGQVGFLDSSGLGALVAVLKLLRPERTLELACLSPGVQKVFALTRMDSVFTVHPTVAAALAAHPPPQHAPPAPSHGFGAGPGAT